MTIQDVGSIGELVAAIATVATLGYLAIQLRENTNALRAESRRNAATQIQTSAAAIGTNKEAASIFRRGLGSYDSLDPDEQTQFQFLFSMMVSQADNVFVDFELGLVTEDWVDTNLAAVLRLLATPGGRRYWELNSSGMAPGFKHWVDAKLGV